MKTIDEIQAALRDLEAAMLKKGIPIPSASIHIHSADRVYIHSRADYNSTYFDGKDYFSFWANTAAEAVQKARDYIAALHSPEEAGINRYLRAVADAVDCGHEENIPDEYVAPLRGVTCAMTENLLENKS